MSGSVRENILETAGKLFFEHGYRAIGVDRIIAESGVAKATLYRYFPSKDDLIVAYLQDINRQYWIWFDASIEPYQGNPREQLLAVFRDLQKLVTTPTCYGCPFLIAATEFPERTHPGHQVALDNKRMVRARLLQLCQEANLKNAAQIADQLFLIMDGAFMAVRTFGIDNPAVQVASQAESIIDCASIEKP
jgi:AcrR family transcriptional regulator